MASRSNSSSGAHYQHRQDEDEDEERSKVAMASSSSTERSISAILRTAFGTLQVALDMESSFKHGKVKISMQSESALLVALSKIQRHIHLIDIKTTSLDTGEIKNAEGGLILCGEGTDELENLQDLMNVLMELIVSESDFVGHVAGKTILVLSQNLLNATFALQLILHTLWNSSKFWCTNSTVKISVNNQMKFWWSSFASKAAESQNPGDKVSTELRGNWIAAARAIRLLHNILKACKHASSSIFRFFLDVTESQFEDIASTLVVALSPLDSIRKSICNQDQTMGVSSSGIPCNASKRIFEGELLVGSWLQFLCSMTHALIQQDETFKGDLMIHSCLLNHIESFLPALASFSLAEHDCLLSESCMSTFLRHKYLMLLFRISRWCTGRSALSVMCLETLRSHAPDLLCLALFQSRTPPKSLLFESPFAFSLLHSRGLNDGSIPKCHLQRRAIYVVFKSVLSLRKVADECKNGPSKDAPGDHLGQTKECGSSEMITEAEKHALQAEEWLIDWLLMQIDLVGDISSYKLCDVANSLASSFLQRFMDEDDVMLQMLLELFNLPILSSFAVHQNESHSLLFATLKPLRLFAAFLSVVHYDHTVIIDYLISNNTGTLCLQYLLRCLHIVGSTWPEFVCMSTTRKENRSAEVTPSLQIHDVKTTHLVFGQRINMMKGACCLVSLKLAIDRMQEKSLFPYNATPLLKRLQLVQQLWQRERRIS